MLPQLNSKKPEEQLRGLEAFSQALQDGAFSSGGAGAALPGAAAGPSRSGGPPSHLDRCVLRLITLLHSSSDARVRQAACRALSACASESSIVPQALTLKHVEVRRAGHPATVALQ